MPFRLENGRERFFEAGEFFAIHGFGLEKLNDFVVRVAEEEALADVDDIFVAAFTRPHAEQFQNGVHIFFSHGSLLTGGGKSDGTCLVGKQVKKKEKADNYNSNAGEKLFVLHGNIEAGMNENGCNDALHHGEFGKSVRFVGAQNFRENINSFGALPFEKTRFHNGMREFCHSVEVAEYSRSHHVHTNGKKRSENELRQKIGKTSACPSIPKIKYIFRKGEAETG